MESEIRKQIDDAVKIAKADKEIPLSELTADIYANPTNNEIRNVTPFKPLSHIRLSTPVNL